MKKCANWALFETKFGSQFDSLDVLYIENAKRKFCIKENTL